MATQFKFKNTGLRISSQEEVLTSEPQLAPIGIATPLSSATEGGGSTFLMHFSIRDQVKDNLRNLLKTNWGERLGEPMFGANLIDYVAELETNGGIEQVTERVVQTVSEWLPLVEVVSVDVDNVREGSNSALAEYVIRVVYQAPELFDGVDAVLVNFRFM